MDFKTTLSILTESKCGDKCKFCVIDTGVGVEVRPLKGLKPSLHKSILGKFETEQDAEKAKSDMQKQKYIK